MQRVDRESVCVMLMKDVTSYSRVDKETSKQLRKLTKRGKTDVCLK